MRVILDTHTFPEAPDRYVANRLRLHRIQALPIQLSHALHVYHLPDMHRDPFDRLLNAQSQLDDIPVLTMDENKSRYEVKVIW